MKFRCPCGHIIRDQTDSLPYKARFLADEDQNAIFEVVIESLEAFMTAKDMGKQEEFLVTCFGEPYPKEIETKDILYDLLVAGLAAPRFIYECENCGRIFFETHSKEAELVSYVPEGESRGVLQSHRRRPDKELSDLHEG